jgi:hypothetical protein
MKKSFLNRMKTSGNLMLQKAVTALILLVFANVLCAHTTGICKLPAGDNAADWLTNAEASPVPMQGLYTVGPGTGDNFSSLTAALTDLEFNNIVVL